MPITIHPSPLADTRTCDYAHVTEAQLLENSRRHIRDVQAALQFLKGELAQAMAVHDLDKITDITGFHHDFIHGFQEPDYTSWWQRHRQLNRHHLLMEDGIPKDVNLIDVLDFIADCVMAGMGRSGAVSPLSLPPELLERAFQNTVAKLTAEVVVVNTP